MLRLLLSAGPVQGSDGTVRITMLTSARKRQPGRAVIELGDKPRSKWEPEGARARLSSRSSGGFSVTPQLQFSKCKLQILIKPFEPRAEGELRCIVCAEHHTA